MYKLFLANVIAISLFAQVQASDLKPINQTIYFDTGSSYIKPKWKPLIREHARFIIKANKRVLVAGFTDEKGERNFNNWLGHRRADRVCDLLLNYGVAKQLVSCVSYGENHPADPANSEDALARNRRVKLIY